MAPHWVSLSFQPLAGAFGCRGLGGGLFVRFLGFVYDFRTCPVGNLECAYLILHISNFSSKFCNIDCQTLHPPRPWFVVLDKREWTFTSWLSSSKSVIIQGLSSSCHFRNPNKSCCPKRSYCPKTCYCPKTFFASLEGFLRFHTNNGFLQWKGFSNFRHLALY